MAPNASAAVAVAASGRDHLRPPAFLPIFSPPPTHPLHSFVAHRRGAFSVSSQEGTNSLMTLFFLVFTNDASFGNLHCPTCKDESPTCAREGALQVPGLGDGRGLTNSALVFADRIDELFVLGRWFLYPNVWI